MMGFRIQNRRTDSAYLNRMRVGSLDDLVLDGRAVQPGEALAVNVMAPSVSSLAQAPCGTAGAPIYDSDALSEELIYRDRVYRAEASRTCARKSACGRVMLGAVAIYPCSANRRVGVATRRRSRGFASWSDAITSNGT